ncbi:MAG: SDR family oxidoreductase [Ignavibacteria bacterium]
MKVLILGGAGLLGHKAYQVFSKEFDTYVTFRNFEDRLKEKKLFDENKVFNDIDAFDFESIKKIIAGLKPYAVLNCIGIIKQLKESQDHKLSIYINSLFPHLLAELCEDAGSRLIHISTDCVFSGKKGNYKEEDPCDAGDLYGLSKYLGEINHPGCLTLRTSIIGHELFTNFSLVDWFLSNEGKTVSGYTNAIFTGFPTVTLCNEIVRIIKSRPSLNGLYNISSEKISKYDLLNLIKKTYHRNIEIEPFKDFYCDRSLDSEKYRKETGFIPEGWEEMIKEMHEDNLKNLS